MHKKKLFINICLGLLLCALFVFFFLKPKYGPQFEILDLKSSPAPTAVSIPQNTHIPNPTLEEKIED